MNTTAVRGVQTPFGRSPCLGGIQDANGNKWHVPLIKRDPISKTLEGGYVCGSGGMSRLN
jgi:ribosome modulation factor